MKKDVFEITVYSSCCNTDKGIYYYKTYENYSITAVDMHREDLDSNRLICYPMQK
jgi:choloylglycine hydrolase